jgi:membrane associated rhomboid family serine protease
MFVHSSFNHLKGNLIMQCIYGTWLELVHGSWRVFTVYICGGITGAMFHSIVSPETGLVGASGGVYALLTANFVAIIMNWREIKTAAIQLFFFLIIGSMQTMFGKENGGSHRSHLGGSVTGVLLGILVLRVTNERPYNQKLKMIVMTIYFAMMVSGVIYHILFDNK